MYSSGYHTALLGRMGYMPLQEPAYTLSPTTGLPIYPVVDSFPISSVPLSTQISDTVPFVEAPAGGGTISLPVYMNTIPVSLTQPGVTPSDIYNPTMAQPVQQLPPTPAPKPFPWLYVGIGAIALLLLSQKKSKPSIGAVNWEKLIIPGAVVIGGDILLKKLGLFGSAEGAANNAAIDDQVQSGNDAALRDLANSGIRPTLNGAQLASLATDIYNRGVASSFSVKASPENQNYIVDDIYQLRNTADIYALKQTFGTKKASTEWYSTCALFGFNCPSIDLDTWLRLVLDSEAITNINDLFSSKGISYTI